MVVCALVAQVGAGCVGPELRHHVLSSETAAYRFSELMRTSRTTRESERAFIDAMREALTAIRRALRLENPSVERGVKQP